MSISIHTPPSAVPIAHPPDGVVRTEPRSGAEPAALTIGDTTIGASPAGAPTPARSRP